MLKKRVGIVVAGGVLVLAALAVFIVLRNSAARDEYGSKDYQYGVWTRTPAMRDAAQSRRDQFIARAKIIRAKWEPWAREHNTLLAHMKTSSPGDLSVLKTVYNTIPNKADYSGNAGVSSADLTDGDKTHWDLDDKHSIKFTWQGFKPSKPDKDVDNYNVSEFQKHRDFPLAVSEEGGGSSMIKVWVSGRVTETVLVEQHIPGKPVLRREEVELQPSYGFIP